jgi:hypothetical protein
MKIQFTDINGFDNVDFESEIKKLVPNLKSFELESETNFTKIFKIITNVIH